ncbi:MAG TPA: outer membrane lipoprotein carrier protein LolA, partial [Verrucomicrobiae bacterium]|nr:outer membrane lipoprotein carrier protein LolA [Verrucomicrobiae bacterium]
MNKQPSNQYRLTTVIHLCLLALSAWCFSSATASAEDINPLVSSWLDQQKNVHTFSADLHQTRKLKSLTQPLTSTGKVYFAEPNRFHWELGNPPQTIAVRSGDTLQVIYPKLKRAENYSLNDAGPFRDTLSLLDAGFPRSESELTAQFNIQSQNITNGICEVALQPKSVGARKMMPLIQISFATNDLSLRAT